MKSIRCPYCQTKLSLPCGAAGQEVDCPECSRPFLISRDSLPIATVGLGKGKRHFFRSVLNAIIVPARKTISFVHDNQIFSAAIVLLLSVIVYCLFNRYDIRNIGGSGVVIDHLTGGGYNASGKRIFIR